MASKTSSGLVIIVVAVAGAFFAPKLVGMVGSLISEVTGANDAKIIGEGDTAIMVAADATPKVAPCTTQKILQEKKCAGLRILTVDAAKMPFIARNTKLAWESGRPALLSMNRSQEDPNRIAACSRFKKSYSNGSCDEYPMAVTVEGGSGARTDEVPLRENSCQGGSYRSQYPRDGEKFLVVIQRPELIAPGPFTGTDIAKEQGLC